MPWNCRVYISEAARNKLPTGQVFLVYSNNFVARTMGPLKFEHVSIVSTRNSGQMLVSVFVGAWIVLDNEVCGGGGGSSTTIALYGATIGRRTAVVR